MKRKIIFLTRHYVTMVSRSGNIVSSQQFITERSEWREEKTNSMKLYYQDTGGQSPVIYGGNSLVVWLVVVPILR